MGGWAQQWAPAPAAHGPTTGDLEAIEGMLTTAGAPEFGADGEPMTLRERVAWLTDARCIVSCDRCQVRYRVVERGSAAAAAGLDQFLAEHRHGTPVPGAPLVEHVRRLEVFPGDVVECQLATQASRETMAVVRQELERLLPEGVNVVVLSRPSHLTVKLSEERRRPHEGRRPA